MLLKSNANNSKVAVLLITSDDMVTTMLRIDKQDEKQVDLGTIKLPILQRKDVSLSACPGYSGAEKVTVNFSVTNFGYENMEFIEHVKFLETIAVELTLDQTAVEVRLPATASMSMRLATSGAGYLLANDSLFATNQYQTDDSQVDPLELVICN